MMADARTVESTARRNSDERWRLWSVSDPGIIDLWARGGLMRGMRWYSLGSDGRDLRQSAQNSSATSEL